MPKSFCIKRVQKVKTGFFPWNRETLVQGCCIEYEEDSDGNQSYDDEHLSEIRLLAPWSKSSQSPPRLILSSAYDNVEKEACLSTTIEHRVDDVIIPSPLGSHYHHRDDERLSPLPAMTPCDKHTNEYPLSAVHIIDKRFSSPWHLGTSENRKKHQCEYCLKWFDRSSSLSNHRLIHKNHKSFKCMECNMSFLRKSDLGKHMVTHSGCKPYQCNVCGKRFSQSSNMLTHQRRHTGIRPYSCGECGKAFYRKVDVRRHAAVHKNL